jgi:hypothetical protein
MKLLQQQQQQQQRLLRQAQARPFQQVCCHAQHGGLCCLSPNPRVGGGISLCTGL